MLTSKLLNVTLLNVMSEATRELTVSELMLPTREKKELFTRVLTVKELVVPNWELIVLVVIRLSKRVLAVMVLAIKVLAFTEPR